MKRFFLVCVLLCSSQLLGFNNSLSIEQQIESISQLPLSTFAGAPLFNNLQSMQKASLNGAPNVTAIINKLQSPLSCPYLSIFSQNKSSYTPVLPSYKVQASPIHIPIVSSQPTTFNQMLPRQTSTPYVQKPFICSPEQQSFLTVQSSWDVNSTNPIYAQRAQRYERSKHNLWDDRSHYYYVPETSRYGTFFNRFQGNGVQQIFHEEMVDIAYKINHIECTPSKTKRLSNQFIPMIDAMLLQADKFNCKRSYYETQQILDCSHGLSNVFKECNVLENYTDRPFGFLEATKATVKGAVHGVARGATNLALFGAMGTIPYAQPALAALMISSLAISLIPEACSMGHRFAKAAYLAVDNFDEFCRRYDAWEKRHRDALHRWWNTTTADPLGALYSGTAFVTEQATTLFGATPFNTIKNTIIKSLTKKAKEYGVDTYIKNSGVDRVASSVRNVCNKVKSKLSPSSCSIVQDKTPHSTKPSTQKVISSSSDNIQKPFRRVRPKDDYKAEIEWAPLKWEEIRRLTDDVEKIAQNTSWPKRKIQRIKNHLFYSKHILDDKIAPFDPNHEIASAWDRLYKGDFIANDIKLLKHEYVESRYECLYKTTYRKAHERIKKEYPWDYPTE